MKKYAIMILAASTIALAGCGGMTQEQTMMLEEIQSQLNEIQFQANSNAAAAARAKDMAEEALIKASMSKGSSRHMMHHKNMMK